MRLRFWSYSMKSSYARTIANRLGGLVIKHEGSTYQYRPGDVIVNWGASHVPSQYPVHLNPPEAIAICCSKLRSYALFDRESIQTCPWTTDQSKAKQWFDQGHDIYARTVDQGARGRGITVIKAYDGGSWENQLANASATGNIRFYTKRVVNNREFRIYVVGDTITSVLEKRRRDGTNPSEYVRNHGNWIFGRTPQGPVPQSLFDLCVKANKAIGLDFSGVDAVLTPDGTPVILEVNSAPGIGAPTSQTEFVAGLAQLLKDRFNYNVPAV